MRRLLTLALLTVVVVALARPAAAATSASSSDHAAPGATAPGSLGTSKPVDDVAHWRPAQATSAAVTASPWRIPEWHAQLATWPVFVQFAVPQTSFGRPFDARPYAPLRFLNDSLRI